MQTKSLIALGALALVAGSAFAAELPNDSTPLTREQVRQSVIAARAAGELQATGPAYDGPPVRTTASDSSLLSRAEVNRDVLVARAEGQLAPAGEAGDNTFFTPPATSTVARATVKAETLQARADGELIPAGEDVGGAAATRSAAFTAMAPKTSLFSSLFQARRVAAN